MSVGLAQGVDDSFDCAQRCVGRTVIPRAHWIRLRRFGMGCKGCVKILCSCHMGDLVLFYGYATCVDSDDKCLGDSSLE